MAQLIWYWTHKTVIIPGIRSNPTGGSFSFVVLKSFYASIAISAKLRLGRMYAGGMGRLIQNSLSSARFQFSTNFPLFKNFFKRKLNFSYSAINKLKYGLIWMIILMFKVRLHWEKSNAKTILIFVATQYKHSCFSDFVFKIRLIRLGFSFQKTKNSCIWTLNRLIPS